MLDRDVAKKSRDELAATRLHTIGFVFQGFNLLPRTSAVENVELPLNCAGAKREEWRERALAALERVGLRGRADHTPAQLSGGQQQRVAIARARVNRPALLLADEPKGNIDSKTSLEVMTLLQELNRAGLTVQHDLDIAAYASRRLVIKDGRLRADERHPPKSTAADLAAWTEEP